MATLTPVDMNDKCRICGKRFNESSKSVDIFKSGPAGSNISYAQLMMMIQLNSRITKRDRKSRRIGITCAKELDEWRERRIHKKLLEIQRLRMKQEQM
ncbi:Hypothetical predicted protein [Cloeon dipterum]|uniref:Uncharacterized protein n=1 Tax=Cloeon dipterum TaxID=197152 RepID=A0A8S1DNZ6_9INSE|nr:Hypothetical predicted protein [Cloeon dipterum]